MNNKETIAFYNRHILQIRYCDSLPVLFSKDDVDVGVKMCLVYCQGSDEILEEVFGVLAKAGKAGAHNGHQDWEALGEGVEVLYHLLNR